MNLLFYWKFCKIDFEKNEQFMVKKISNFGNLQFLQNSGFHIYLKQKITEDPKGT